MVKVAKKYPSRLMKLRALLASQVKNIILKNICPKPKGRLEQIIQS